jgi:hypothetical protein
MARIRRAVAVLTLRAHRLADRLDIVPDEFGKAEPVDEADASTVAAEWLRCLRLWASYNPEEVFALKIGAALLGALAAGLWILVAMMR